MKDATGTFTMAFVFLVAFAWMSAGLALSMRNAKAAPEDIELEIAGGVVKSPPAAGPSRETAGARS